MTIVYSLQGRVFEAKDLSRVPQAPPRTEKRGDVRGFSRRSRSRMIDLMMRLDLSGVKVTFLTLTFASVPQVSAAKISLKRFLMRVRRQFPNVSGIWRMEKQTRGAIHFHLLMFNLPFWPQRELQAVWEACTGELRSIVHIKLISTHRRLLSYVSKYVAKVDDGNIPASLDDEPYQHAPQQEKTGRIWGYFQKSALPIAERFDLVSEDTDLRGYFWFAARAATHGRTGKWEYFAKVYSEEAEDWYIFALQHGATTLNAFSYAASRPAA